MHKHPPEHWMKTQGLGAKVVILDSWYGRNTPHIFPAQIRSFTTAPPAKGNSHGTSVAKVIASADPSNLGIAPRASIYIGEVVGPLEHGWASLSEALDWVISLKPDVVNMSFACPASEMNCDQRLAHLDASGTICLASCNPFLHWPHSLSTVISVGTEGQKGSCDLRTISEIPVMTDGRLEIFRGSSAACAVASAIAACAKAANPALNRAGFLDVFNS